MMKEFRFSARVYFSDTDAGGIAYHRSYFDWAEHARTEILRTLVPDLPQSALASDSGILSVIKSIEIHYRQPAYLDDEIEVVSTLESVRHFSCVIKQCVMRSGEILADLTVKAAFIDKETKHPVAIPEAFVKAFEEDK